MKLVKEIDSILDLNSVIRVDSIKNNVVTSHPILLVDDCHYIGSYLSSLQIAPISLDGLRYNLLSGFNINISGNDINDPSKLIKPTLDMYTVPTGVSQESGNEVRPKAFRYRGIIAFENNELINSLKLYAEMESGIELVATVTEINNKDRLILIVDNGVDFNEFHAKARHPHRFNRNYLSQGLINSFNTIGPRESLGAKVPRYKGIHGAFCIRPPFEEVNVDDYLDISGCDPDNNVYKYTWRLITRLHGNPYLPSNSNKLM